MIFVTVGTQKFQFNRLFRKLDQLKGELIIRDIIIGQRGVSDYHPRNFKTFDYCNLEKMKNYIDKCDILITHAGTSSIIQGLRSKKKVLVVPRLKEFNEHIDDHQIELARVFENKNLIEVVYKINDLESKIRIAKSKKYSDFQSDNLRLLNSINAYLKEIFN